MEERPRSTKVVYFYKSGDPFGPPARLVVNKKRYRTLDALLDDLSTRVPGLNYGCRKLRTSRGRHPVKNLDELQHEDSYVCSDSLRRGRVPGIRSVLLPRTRSTSGPVNLVTMSSSTSLSPKRRKKKKKKGKKKKGKKRAASMPPESSAGEAYSEVTSPVRKSSSDADLTQTQEIEVHRERSESPKPKSSVVSHDASISREATMSVTPEQEYSDVDDKWHFEIKEAGKPTAGRKLTTESEADLTKLDSKRLKHVQRRRLASRESMSPTRNEVRESMKTPDSGQNTAGKKNSQAEEHSTDNSARHSRDSHGSDRSEGSEYHERSGSEHSGTANQEEARSHADDDSGRGSHSARDPEKQNETGAPHSRTERKEDGTRTASASSKEVAAVHGRENTSESLDGPTTLPEGTGDYLHEKLGERRPTGQTDSGISIHAQN